MAYCTIADVRAEGITVAMADDVRVAELIARWTVWINEQCGQWFEERDLDIYFDGSGGKIVHFQVPLISCTSLYLNESTTVQSTDDYVVYNGRGGTENDDRKNPKIVLKRGNERDIFSRRQNRFLFVKGARNQRFVGKMGYTEADGTTPVLIKLALLTIIANNYQTLIASGMSPVPPATLPGVLKSELTDGHQVVYGLVNSYVAGVLAANPTVGDILRAYHAPLKIGVTGVSYNSLGD